MTDANKSERGARAAQVFPPALVPLLRRRLGEGHTCCRAIDDETLSELLTVIFFAGFETEEGEHYPVRVVFVGDNPADWIAPDQTAGSGGPIYRWSAMRFDTLRPFVVPELVKLAVATATDRMYTRVRCENGQ